METINFVGGYADGQTKVVEEGMPIPDRIGVPTETRVYLYDVIGDSNNGYEAVFSHVARRSDIPESD